jgi:hypothetical protein
MDICDALAYAAGVFFGFLVVIFLAYLISENRN